MVILNLRIRDRARIRGLGRRMRGFYKQVLIDVAWFWHRHILRKHFTSGARAEYGYKPRTPRYVKWKRKHGVGQGKFIDLWLSGASRRQLMSGATVSATAGKAKLTMRAPWYFRNPNGQIQNRRNKKFSSKVQPNKPREVTAMSARDKQSMRRYASARLRFFMNSANLAQRTVHSRG